MISFKSQLIKTYFTQKVDYCKGEIYGKMLIITAENRQTTNTLMIKVSGTKETIGNSHIVGISPKCFSLVLGFGLF